MLQAQQFLPCPRVSKKTTLLNGMKCLIKRYVVLFDLTYYPPPLKDKIITDFCYPYF